MAKHMTMEEFVLLLKLQGITVTIYETTSKNIKSVNLHVGSFRGWNLRFFDVFKKSGYYITEYGKLPTLDLVYEKIQAHLTSDN